MTYSMINRRLLSCLEQWPDAEEGAYNPACCRFPKSCSATVYGDEISDDKLEPGPETQPASLADLGRVFPNLPDGQLAEAHNALVAAGCRIGVDRHGTVHFDVRNVEADRALRAAFAANAATAPAEAPAVQSDQRAESGRETDAQAPRSAGPMELRPVVDRRWIVQPGTRRGSWAFAAPLPPVPGAVCGQMLAERDAPSSTHGPWPVDAPLDLAKIGTEWARSCGSCDAGLPMSCTCPQGDPRPVVAGLLAEIERLRADQRHTYERALFDAARRVRAELVCCDVYGRAAGNQQAVDDAEEAGHGICFWGEAAARLVDPTPAAPLSATEAGPTPVEPEAAPEATAVNVAGETALPVGPPPRLNIPMVAKLRKCAADTSPNWDGAVTVYPPEARGLVALIDWAASVHAAAPVGPDDDQAAGISEDHIAAMSDGDLNALVDLWRLRDLVNPIIGQMDLDCAWDDWRTRPIRQALVIARSRGWDDGDPTDRDHERGLYCGEPSHCTEPHPGALPGTPYPPAPPVDPEKLPSPDSCRWCEVIEREHGTRWTAPRGRHGWEPPTPEVRRERMLARRAAVLAQRKAAGR